jgi:prophage regulatory protein
MTIQHTSIKTPAAPVIPVMQVSVKASLFDALPDGAFVRQSQLVSSAYHPGTPVLLPFSAPTLWRMVKKGTFPQPIRLSARLTCWRVGQIRAWLASHASK